MPELPEVQTLVDDLIAAGIPGRGIVRVRLFWTATVATPSGNTFQSRMRGRRINSINRRGKYILLGLDRGDTLIVHLRMTGRFVLADEAAEPDRHVHVVIGLDDGQ